MNYRIDGGLLFALSAKLGVAPPVWNYECWRIVAFV